MQGALSHVVCPALTLTPAPCPLAPLSCLIMYTVALPGYADDHPMPVLAMWRLACTAIGIAVELAVALLVFPVTARDAAHATAAGALRGMADVADRAFMSVLKGPEGKGGDKGGPLPRQPSREGGICPSSPVHACQPSGPAFNEGSASRHCTGLGPGSPRSESATGSQPSAAPSPLPPTGMPAQHPPSHVKIACPSDGWQGSEVAHGAVLRRIHQPMMEVRLSALSRCLGRPPSHHCCRTSQLC